MKSPDESVHCLLVQPQFPEGSFWNYKLACEALGAKTPMVPLGLLTVAALLPQFWKFRLVDRNCDDLRDEDWAWADIVALGGMLPQQRDLLQVLVAAKQRGKFVVVGGPDPTSQPDVYSDADARVLDEGESSIPLWLESWRRGQPRGIFRGLEKPDMTLSPPPRYDLLTIENYNQLAIQISRGCPFNCEFCDIIELYGRKPRIKTPDQVVRELEGIRRTGYAGPIDIVDDNFIGNKRVIRTQILPALLRWNRAHLRPFYFTTQASLNLGDDIPLMRDMRMAGFRFVFFGIETPETELLLKTQKSQNVARPMTQRIRQILEQGLTPVAGFIIGFDGEKAGMDTRLIRCIEDHDLTISMVGMLVALPNTQLWRRLQREGRLIGFDGYLKTSHDTVHVDARTSVFEINDQTVTGLNFVTTRDRHEVLNEFRNIVSSVYQPEAYLRRAYRQAIHGRLWPIHIPRLWELKRDLRGLGVLMKTMLADPNLRWIFLKYLIKLIFRGPNALDIYLRLAGMFPHFALQRDYVLQKTMDLKVAFSRKSFGLGRQDADAPKGPRRA